MMRIDIFFHYWPQWKHADGPAHSDSGADGRRRAGHAPHIVGWVAGLRISAGKPCVVLARHAGPDLVPSSVAGHKRSRRSALSRAVGKGGGGRGLRGGEEGKRKKEEERETAARGERGAGRRCRKQ